MPNGEPKHDNDSKQKETTSGWAELIRAIRSPLNVFALTVLVCNAVFALAAAKLNSLTAFTYSMHLFLGIVGAFTLIALWSPRTLYHPEDIKLLDSIEKDDNDKTNKDNMQNDENRRKMIITSVLAAILVGYTAWELSKRWWPPVDTSHVIETALADIVKNGGKYTLICEPDPNDKLVTRCNTQIQRKQAPEEK